MSGRRKGSGPIHDHREGLIVLNPAATRRPILAALTVALAALSMVVAACGQPNSSPTGTPFGGGGVPTNLADVPQPRLATIDLGVAAPGFDGSGSFYSYDSDLSPEETIAAYANQLLRAGFREVDRIGIWRVFVGPRLTVWVRVGSGGPPTSLVVRVQPNEVEVADEPGSRPAAPAPRDQATSGTSGQAGSSGPKPTTRPAAQRRPDPPHGTGATAAGSGSGGGTTIAGGTAAAGSTGSGTITGAGGVGTGGGR